MKSLPFRSQITRSMALLLSMTVAMGLATFFRPVSTTSSGVGRSIGLENMIPFQFGSWITIPNSITAVNPQQQDALNKIYSEVLNRTYRHNETGSIIMLSIAYGSRQSKQSQVHRPDVCYPAQGFRILNSEQAMIHTLFGELPVRRLVTQLGTRTEPLTYWIRIGDAVAAGWIEQKIAIIMEGFSGRVADGVIFRVSTIGDDMSNAYLTQSAFITDLLQSIRPTDAPMFLGKIGRSSS